MLIFLIQKLCASPSDITVMTVKDSFDRLLTETKEKYPGFVKATVFEFFAQAELKSNHENSIAKEVSKERKTQLT